MVKIEQNPIMSNNISSAWLQYLEATLATREGKITPAMLSVEFTENDCPEKAGFREILDTFLKANDKFSCHTTASTIFPISLWNPALDRFQLYKRYEKILPTIKRICPPNRYGTYFERLISFQANAQYQKPINQLDFIIRAYTTNPHIRHSALQASIFDPRKDHSMQPRRGFPCLQHVFFHPQEGKELTLTAVYATQYVFDRAYGNMLGLFHLGKFMAHEMHLSFTRLNCLIGKAELGNISKTAGRDIVDHLNQV